MSDGVWRHGGFADRGTAFVLMADGREIASYPGESLLTALLAAGYRALRRRADGSAAGAYCVMGTCFECAVTVDGVPGVRACMAPATPGCRVETAGDEAAR